MRCFGSQLTQFTIGQSAPYGTNPNENCIVRSLVEVVVQTAIELKKA